MVIAKDYRTFTVYWIPYLEYHTYYLHLIFITLLWIETIINFKRGRVSLVGLEPRPLCILCRILFTVFSEEHIVPFAFLV